MQNNTQESWEEQVNVFIRKWCGVNAPHLLDNDDNDGERLRQLLQKQAEEISEAVLKKVKETDLAIRKADKTPKYEYERVNRNKNNDGEYPDGGGRWAMPWELSKDLVAQIEEDLLAIK